MPREIIEIRLKGVPPGDGVAELLSYIAYPDDADKNERKRFANSLYRSAIMWRTITDDEWGQSFQQFRPCLFLDDRKILTAPLKRGTSIMWRHIMASKLFLTPHLIGLPKGQPQQLHRVYPGFEDINDLKAPTIENMAILLARSLGLEDGSFSTVKSRVWSRTKPIAHLGYAFWEWMHIEKRLAKDTDRTIEHMYFPTFFSDGGVFGCLAIAEHRRQQLPSINQFKIKEEDTIQFVAV